jgi:molecular chaperone HtpG
VASGDLGLDEGAEEQLSEEEKQEHQELFKKMKELLAERVQDVRSSKRLKQHPVCLAAEGQISIEMEKVLNSLPNNQPVQAQKVLELNVNHPVFQALKAAMTQDPAKLALYTKLLYNQALLIEGLPLEEPVEFSNHICELMK